MVIVDRRLVRTPRQLFRVLVECQVTTLMATPYLFLQMDREQRDHLFRRRSRRIHHPLAQYPVSALRRIVLGGDAFPEHLLLDDGSDDGVNLPPTPPVQLWNIYGTTECSVWATLAHLNGGATEQAGVHLGSPIGSSTRLEIRCENGQVYRYPWNVDVDVVGEIWLGGQGRRCYLNDETEPLVYVLGVADGLLADLLC